MSKISQLPVTTTLNNTDDVPIVQGGANKKAAIALWIAKVIQDALFAEAVDDRVGALLQPGSNISLAYNDTTNTLTISAAAAATLAQGAKADSALQPAAIGTTIQPFDADLAAIAALPTTSFGRSLLTRVEDRLKPAYFNAVAETITGTTTETNFATYSFTIPANTIPSNGSLRIYIATAFSGSGTRTFKAKIGSTEILSLGAIQNLTSIRYVCNRNSQNQQIIFGSGQSNSFANVAGAFLATTIDFTVDQVLTFSYSSTVAGDSCTLNTVLLEYLF